MMHDRYVEFHTREGLYTKMRIPKFGRDMSYHKASCDMYFVGVRLVNNFKTMEPSEIEYVVTLKTI